ncbi:MAG: hypothetical protein RMN25_08720 [Anaerolineae bacterium]|nr:ammonium transporter [Thermoflexales bacterium]MDW8407856.1 hypothetical protein [Anaerolineae bacterium]
MGVNITPLLLPLGIWLMLSAAAPRRSEGRIAASGMLAFGLAACAFFAIGFGLMFGGIGAVLNDPGLSRFVTYYTFPVAGRTWGLLGLRGFLLQDAGTPEALNLFIAYLPLVAANAMLIAGLMAHRTGFIAQTIVIALVSGIIFPIVGFWIWGGGWLAKTGLNLSLGHGVVDVGGLATASLIAGVAGAIWLMLLPKRQAVVAPNLPPNHFPFRALSGAVLTLIGAGAFIAGNPIYAAHGINTASAASSFAVNLTLASTVAALLALGYSFLVTRRADTLCAARAALAAVIIVSAGGPLFDTALIVALGVVATGVAILGMYLVREVLHWADDHAIVSTAGLSGVIGLLAVGLFANGRFGAGWNGVGAVSFLGQNGLGVVGALTFGNAPADPGQLTAQLTAISAIVTLTAAVFSLPALLLRRLAVARQAFEIEEIESQATSTSGALSDLLHHHPPAQAQAGRVDAEPQSLVSDSPPAIPEPATLGELPFHLNPAHSNVQQPETDQPTENIPADHQAPPKLTLLDRIRAARNKDEAGKPLRARHVAYPNRAGGRRVVIQPLPDDQMPAPPAPEGS